LAKNIKMWVMNIFLKTTLSIKANI